MVLSTTDSEKNHISATQEINMPKEQTNNVKSEHTLHRIDKTKTIDSHISFIYFFNLNLFILIGG